MEVLSKTRHLLFSLMTLLSLVFVTSCREPVVGPEEPEKPVEVKDTSISVDVSNVLQNQADMVITSESMIAVAYLVLSSDAEQNIGATDIFKQGIVIDIPAADVDSTETEVLIDKLSPNTEYEVFVAGRLSENEIYAMVSACEFTTADYEEGVHVYNISPSEFTVTVKLPELQDPNNVVKWGLADLATYNMNAKMNMFGYLTDAEILNLNDEVYANYFRHDTTIVFNSDNAWRRDENGNLLTDEYGDNIQYYNPITPGQPSHVMFGEFSWGEHDYGFGEGYYKFLFDYESFINDYYEGAAGPEADYWSGFYNNTQVITMQPEPTEGGLNITTDLTPKGGLVRIDPDDDITEYVVLPLDQATLDMVMLYLNNDESYLQWYVTSYNAFMTLGAQTASGPTEFLLEEVFYEVDRSMPYYVLVTGMGDEEGTKQCFEKVVLNLPEPTEPAPKVVVTAITNPLTSEESPYEVWFNIKSVDGDVASAKYAANYERKWDALINDNPDVSMTDLVDNNGYDMTEDEIAAINSDEGLNISFSSLPRMNTMLAVAGANREGTYEDLDADGCQAIATATSSSVPAKERVESSLFTELAGEWTATATCKYKYYDYNTSSYKEGEETITSPVTIGETSHPATLPQDVYDLYATSGYTKEMVDALYEEFNDESDVFNQEVRSQNRLLCLGYNFGSEMSTASPYDLFVMSDYSAYDIPALFYDFGSKWYLEVDKNGNVSVPFNSERLYPLSSWQYQYSFYMMGVGNKEDGTQGFLSGPVDPEGEWPAFPVEVSSDRQTITVKPLEYEGYDLYPNVAYIYFGQASLKMYQVVSDVVLTRGTAASAGASAMRKIKTADLPSVQPIGSPLLRAPHKHHAKTILLAPEVVEYQKADIKAVTKDEFIENIKNYLGIER